MIKIQKTELLKGFILYEIVFVVLPVAAVWLAILALFLLSKITQYDSPELFILFLIIMQFILILSSLYFVLPGQIASKLFGASLFGFVPKGIIAWIFTITIYSFFAVLFAIAVSLYKSLQKQNKSQSGCIIEPTSGEMPQADKS